MNAPALILATIGAVAAYFFLCSRIAIAVQPIRLAIASIGEELLASGRLPEVVARHIQLEMAQVYSSRSMWLYTVLLPVAAVWVTVDRFRGIGEHQIKVPRELRGKYNRLLRYLWISRIATSPLAAVLFLPISIVCVMVVTVLAPTKAVRELLETSRKADEIVNGIGDHRAKPA